MQSSSGTRRSVRSFILDTTCIPWSTYLRCNGFLIRSSTIFKDIKVQKRNDPQAHQNREPIRHQAARCHLPLIHVRQALKCFDYRLVSRSAIARSLKSPIAEKNFPHTMCWKSAVVKNLPCHLLPFCILLQYHNYTWLQTARAWRKHRACHNISTCSQRGMLPERT